MPDGPAPAQRIILASRSATRGRMLEAAGVAFSAVASSVDETAIREALAAQGGEIDPADVAEVLARAKAEDVSNLHPDALVIGGDQVLELDGVIFAKPETVEAAREILLELRGRTHQLHAAAAIAVGGEVTWAATDSAHLTMRRFSAGFLEEYLGRMGSEVLQSVGSYQVEGYGVQLFEAIEGDFFTILGLPLLSLLDQLRDLGAVPK